MKPLYLILFMGLLVGACTPPETNNLESRYEPIFMGRNVMEGSIELQPPRPIINAGKIFVQGNLLFVNERFEGVHVIDNTEPKNPIPEAFIRIPGNIDVAVHNNLLIVDQAVDLVMLQYANSQLVEVDRKRNMYDEFDASDGLQSVNFNQSRPDTLILIRWEAL